MDHYGQMQQQKDHYGHQEQSQHRNIQEPGQTTHFGMYATKSYNNWQTPTPEPMPMPKQDSRPQYHDKHQEQPAAVTTTTYEITYPEQPVSLATQYLYPNSGVHTTDSHAKVTSQPFNPMTGMPYMNYQINYDDEYDQPRIFYGGAFPQYNAYY